MTLPSSLRATSSAEAAEAPHEKGIAIEERRALEELDLIAVDRIRDVNRRAKIVCRAFHDEPAEVLTREWLACVVLSTSRHAAEVVVRTGALRGGVTDVPEALSRRALALA